LSDRFSGTVNQIPVKLILIEKKYIIFILLLQLLLCPQSITAQDSTAVAAKTQNARKSFPMKATMLAAALPGSGQIYNRKYWKIPVVYAGFGGLGYAIVFNSTQYNKYTKAYQDFTDKVPETDSYLSLIRGLDPKRYDPVLYPNDYNISDETQVKEGLLRQIDYFKKYRDLSMMGIAAWYLITILDANVDASLADYDIGENINLTFAPMQVPGYYSTGLGLNISLRINF
jgi:hypothetical protein